MTINRERCPFKVGDLVVYRPSKKGLDSDVMSSTSEKLVSGKTYRIMEIQQEFYVVVDGYSHPGGGLYWTEFEPNIV